MKNERNDCGPAYWDCYNAGRSLWPCLNCPLEHSEDSEVSPDTEETQVEHDVTTDVKVVSS